MLLSRRRFHVIMAVTSGTSSWMQGSQSYHKIQFDHTEVLSGRSKYCYRLIMEWNYVRIIPTGKLDSRLARFGLLSYDLQTETQLTILSHGNPGSPSLSSNLHQNYRFCLPLPIPPPFSDFIMFCLLLVLRFPPQTSTPFFFYVIAC